MRYFSVVILLFAAHAQGQNTAFTYQGQLNQSGQVADGVYDFQFLLFDTEDFLQSTEFAGPVNRLDQSVAGGNFTVDLDFGSGVFGTQDLWLEIRVRESSAAGPFSTLAPRQKVNAVPLALVATEAQIASQALSANQADIASGVQPGSIGAAEIDAAAVQRRVAGSCPSGSSIRAIGSNGFITCETDSTGDNIFVLSTTYSAQELPNDGNSIDIEIGPPSAGHACFLTYISMEDCDTGSEECNCNINVSGGRWRLIAEAEGDADVTCRMRCIGGL